VYVLNVLTFFWNIIKYIFFLFKLSRIGFIFVGFDFNTFFGLYQVFKYYSVLTSNVFISILYFTKTLSLSIFRCLFVLCLYYDLATIINIYCNLAAWITELVSYFSVFKYILRVKFSLWWEVCVRVVFLVFRCIIHWGVLFLNLMQASSNLKY
jgi:hypothetical protein